jgi:ferrous iron transport protein B
MKIALLGNPGAGKSLIFNQLTGLGVEVNRYPGSSVCLECGNVCYKKEKIEIVDLPGIYSLDGSSEEEILVRKFLESGAADIIVAVLDATKLERNLYLFSQVAEFSPKIIAVVNMIDNADGRGSSSMSILFQPRWEFPFFLLPRQKEERLTVFFPLHWDPAGS